MVDRLDRSQEIFRYRWCFCSHWSCLGCWISQHDNVNHRQSTAWLWSRHAHLLGAYLQHRGSTSQEKRLVLWNDRYWLRFWLFHVSIWRRNRVHPLTLDCSVGWISVAAFYATNLTMQWRLPLALACIGPLAMLIGLPFIPGLSQYIRFKDTY
jgi:hypothetical protein